jgi:hypothetical protein
MRRGAFVFSVLAIAMARCAGTHFAPNAKFQKTGK